MNKPLSERLEHFQFDRPSEWLMKDFVQQAKELEAENKKLKYNNARYKKVLKARLLERNRHSSRANKAELKLNCLIADFKYYIKTGVLSDPLRELIGID